MRDAQLFLLPTKMPMKIKNESRTSQRFDSFLTYFVAS
jgi:hypothetical protein